MTTTHDAEIVTLDQAFDTLRHEVTWLEDQLEFCDKWVKEGNAYFTMIYKSLTSMHTALTDVASALSVGMLDQPWRVKYDLGMAEYYAHRRLFLLIAETAL